jgi:hypothetical protein
VHLNENKKISEKDLVKIKQYPISTDYVVLNPPIGRGSFGSVHRVVHKESGMVFAAKKVRKDRGLGKVL